VDSQGLLVGVVVTEANASERLGAAVVLDEAGDELSTAEVLWVDRGYCGQNFARVVQQICGARVEVIQRIAKTFEILPKRWLFDKTLHAGSWKPCLEEQNSPSRVTDHFDSRRRSTLP